MVKKLTDITPEELLQIVKSGKSNSKTARDVGVTKSTVRYVKTVYNESEESWQSMVQRMWRRMEDRNSYNDTRIMTFEQFKREMKEKKGDS